ncbi:Superoxide dismutase [Heracleum sosnowskyi]|nr:Superoxide dismutase [Heracleum sosnowskyi]KAK1399036.1 Superoxide dismutase [Heracleum sosnowskyi]
MWDDVNSRSISYGVNRKSEKDPRLMDDYERMLDAAISKSDSNAISKLHTALRFNGGGHINHSIFWRNLSPVQEGGGEPPKGSFGGAIDAQFGSLEALVQKMNGEGTALQGSGWVACLIIRNLWLGLDKELKRLVVETTANQSRGKAILIFWKY